MEGVGFKEDGHKTYQIGTYKKRKEKRLMILLRQQEMLA